MIYFGLFIYLNHCTHIWTQFYSLNLDSSQLPNRSDPGASTGGDNAYNTTTEGSNSGAVSEEMKQLLQELATNVSVII